MTYYNPTFSVSDFELRNYTEPYLTQQQATDVSLVEDRVESQLDFLAQMLGWNGPNYWTNLASTVDQKRQLLSGTFGVYNSFVIPRIYEVRNWDETIVIDRLQFVRPGRVTQVAQILLGDNQYQLRSVVEEGDKYVVSIGPLDQEFYDLIAVGEQLRINIPTYRQAPFVRPSIGISGDYTFICKANGSELQLYSTYDDQDKLPFRFKILFSGATYYFNQPIYLSRSSDLTPDITPEYDATRNQWFFSIPAEVGSTAGISAYLVWANSNPVQADNISTEVLIQSWTDPSDWGSLNVLNNFKGTWANKGGFLPFNLVFDALSIHGFSEENSLYLPEVTQELRFNDIVNFVYYQKTTISDLAPGNPTAGDLWWNDDTGALSVWLPDALNCANWVQIDYRQSPRQNPIPQIVYPNVAAFRAAAPSAPLGVVVKIENTSGLDTTDEIIGLQGTMVSPGTLLLHLDPKLSLWVPDEFTFVNVNDFQNDARVLPYEVPVILHNAAGLSSSGPTYSVQNLSITISGDYDVLLLKFFNNENWALYPDTILKYIAESALFNGLQSGEMWWDYVNADPNTRAANIYYSSPAPITQIEVLEGGTNLVNGVYTAVPIISTNGTGALATVDVTVVGGSVATIVPNNPGVNYVEGEIFTLDPVTAPELSSTSFVVKAAAADAWIATTGHPQSGTPAATLDFNVILFYCNDVLVQNNVPYITDDFIFLYQEDVTTGTYSISYTPRTFLGKVNLPTIVISDSLTTTYRADISELVFSGITYRVSPNLANAESPLRVWKSQELQVADTLNQLAQDNYINPLVADLNTGPGPDNWEKFFIRLPFEYGRNDDVWQKVALICQDFTYWGSSVETERMKCPPEDDTPAIYEELFLYGEPTEPISYIYAEPYLYSNIAFFGQEGDLPYRNAGLFPTFDAEFDEFDEGALISYDPLHNRLADVTSPVGAGYGDWQGDYVSLNPCIQTTGFFTTDLLNDAINPVEAPIWDASIYKFAPTCENASASYSVDSNHYKMGYAYFVADLSAAEETFFDVTQEIAWRDPITQTKTGYLTPR